VTSVSDAASMMSELKLKRKSKVLISKSIFSRLHRISNIHVYLPFVSILSPDAPLHMFFDSFDGLSVNVDKLLEAIAGC